MGRHFRVSFMKPDNSSPRPAAQDPVQPDLLSPFGKINGLNQDEFRQAAYEVFFTACRSSPGFGSRNNSFSEAEGNAAAPGSPMKAQGVGMAVTSRVKTTLGLKMLKRSLSTSRSRSLRRMSSSGLNPSSPTAGAGSSPRVGFTVPQGGRMKRPMTSAEIMRQQMRLTEQNDNRLRKTLAKALVGQMGRRTETIILPLELLRHVKPSEFNDAHEYHLWQKRQLRILEAGLVLHPSKSLEKSNPHVTKLKGMIHAADMKPLDTGRNTRTMKALNDCVVPLALRGGSDNCGTEACHWADGYPLNVHLYMALLSSIFDLKDETLVLDEVDELLELIKKTWPTLGFNRPMHNLCFAWLLFERFVMTGQVEPDLVGASFAMLREVESDAKKQVDRDPIYMKMLANVSSVMSKWSEKRLQDYHANFNRATAGLMENMLPLLSSSSKILQEDVPLYVASSHRKGAMNDELSGNRVEDCIRSSLKNAFAKMVEKKNDTETKLTSESLIELAAKTEELAAKEKDIFTPVLKKWSSSAAGIASLTLHSCYGIFLKQYLCSKSWQLNEMLSVLQKAGKLEKALMEMVADESTDCDDGGKGILKQMVLYEVDSIISRLLKQWIQDKLDKGKEHMLRVKQTETWNPKLKTEPYAHSAMELVAFAKEAVDSFYQLAVNIPENLFHDFVYGLENVFFDYITFVASCGSNQNYLPTIPPVTRCSRDSRLFKLWKRAACSVAVEDRNWDLSNEGHNHVRASTSRGTQRLYIRLNSLHYLSTQLQSLEKTLYSSPNVASPTATLGHRRQPSYSYLEKCLSAIQTASQHVSQVAASRLIFLDSNSVFYGNLYSGSVVRARIGPAIQSLKHNLAILCAIVVERAQPLVLKEVMKASFDAFLRVILTGGSSRVFSRADHPMIDEDLDSLKQVFCVCGEGLIVEDMVEREAEAAEGVVALMGESTEQLIDDFISTVTNGGCGINILSPKQKIQIPPTTGNWSRSDPNTILRVLCGRKDRTANDFLKKTLHLAKRRPGIKML